MALRSLIITVATALVAAVVVLVAVPVPDAEAQLYDPPAIRYQTNARGDIEFIGNTVLTCPASSGTCAQAQAGTINAANNQYSMVYVDVDSVGSTFNSSTATLNLPSTANVLFAGLYWGARSSNSARNQVLLDTPAAGGYSTVTAAVVDSDGGSNYQGFYDATADVIAAGNGDYTVANVQAATGTNRHGGWSLIVTYEDTALPLRNLTVYDGFARVTQNDPVTITVNGFLTPATGPVTARVTNVVYEGDQLYTGDRMAFEGTLLSDAIHPATNYFNSRISRDGVLFTAKNPNYVDQLGFDIARSDATGLLGNGQTSATVDYTSQGDWYYVGVVATAIDIFAPDLDTDLVKTSTDLDGGVPKPGDTIEYTISTSNTGQDPALNVFLTDPIPAGTTYVPGSLEIVSHPDAALNGTTPDDSVANIAVDGGGFDGSDVLFDMRTLDPGDAFEVRFRVTIDSGTEGDDVDNVATLESEAATTGDPYTDTGTDTFTVVAVADLVLVSKVDSADPVDAGDSFDYTITVRNDGPSPAVNPIVTDPLPAGVTFVSGAGCSESLGVVTCSLGATLANGATDTATFTVAIDETLPAGSLSNKAAVSSDTLDEDGTDNSGGEDTTVTRDADLSIDKQGSPATVRAGNQLTYTLTADNNGPSSAEGVTVVDDLPGGVTLISATADNGGSCAGDPTITCTLGTILSGETVIITIVIDTDPATPDGTTLVNNSSVSSSTPDSSSGNDTSQETTPVLRFANLTIDKTGPATATAGGEVTFTIDVGNTGPSIATGVILSDPLPAPLTFNAVGSSPSCSLNVGVVECGVVDLMPGDAATVTIVADVPPSAPVGTITNTASVTAVEDATGDSDPHDVDIERSVSLGITKVDDVDPIVAGQVVTYTIGVTNGGPSDAANVVVSDPVPASMTFNAAASSGSCSLNAGVVECAVGTVAAGGSTSVDIAFTIDGATSSGPITNVATVTSDEDATGATTNEATTVVAQAPAITLDKATTTSEITAAGQIIPYTFEVTNTGNVDLDPVAVTDPQVAGISCPQTQLAPSESMICTGSYTVQQTDVDAGLFTNTATATGTSPIAVVVNSVDAVTVNATQNPSVDLVKNADVTSVSDAGDPVNFSFVVANTGNVTLTGVVVDDPDVGAVTCDVTTLAPGAQANCTAPTFNVTQAQIDAGGFTNSADVDALDPSSTLVEDSDSIFINAPAAPAVDLVKNADVTTVNDAGDPVNFSFAVTNTGNVTLTGVVVDDPDVGAVTCDVTTLAPGAQANCTAPTYNVTQVQIDAGGFTNTADVDAFDPSSTLVEDSDSIFIDAPAAPAVDLEKNADVTTVTDAGDPVNFSFVVTNTGNVTLTGVVVDDPDVGLVTCDVTSLAPGAQANCTAPTFNVTQAQIDAGGFTNSADVDALDPSSALIEDSDSIFIDAPAAPAVDLMKNADVTTVNDAGDPVNFSFVVTNTGNVTLTGVVVDDPDVGAVTCDVTTLAPGGQANCTAPTFNVTQPQIDAGGFTNSAEVDALDPSSTLVEDSDSIFIDAPAAPSVDLVKNADVTTVSDAGDPVNFSFVVTNTGNVTLTGVVVDDPDVGAVTCDVTTLAPGGQANCTAPTFNVTQAQIDAGGFTNTADVDALDPSSGLVEDSDSIFIDAPAGPAVDLEKNADVTTVNDAGDPVNFSFVVTNTGNVSLTGVVVDDPDVGAVTCDVTSLAPGAQANCTAPTYSVTQAQIDAGGFTNSADVDALDPSSALIEDSDSIFIDAPAAPSVDLVKNADVTSVSDAGDPVNFSFVVTNTGNVTLTGVVVDDPDVGLVTCDVTSLAPGAQANCTAPTFNVIQAQIDAGGFTNSADVDALDPSSALIEDSDSIFIDAPAAPAVDLVKNADVTSVSDAGDPVNFSFVVTNTGNVTLTGVVVDDPDVGLVTCDVTSLAPGAQANCTAPTFTVTQAQIDAGGFTNSADVDALDPSSALIEDSDSIFIDAPAAASVDLVKNADVTSVSDAGDPANFSFVVTNTGNVTLTGVVVDDPDVGLVTCDVTSLAPGAQANCTAPTFNVTQAQIDAGGFTNTADVDALDPSSALIEDSDSIFIDAPAAPSVDLDKNADVTSVSDAGDPVNFSFVVTNTGNVTLTGVVVDDPDVGLVTCDVTSLAPGAQANCTAPTFNVTQAQIDAGGFTNSADVDALDPSSALIEDSDSIFIDAPAAASVDLVKNADVTSVSDAGDPVNFSFVVTNTGNVTLTGVVVDDPDVGAVTCDVTTLAPGAQANCTAPTFNVTQAQVDAGGFTNSADVDALDPSSALIEGSDSIFIDAPAAAAVDLVKNADVTTVNDAGDPVNFSFVVTNTGNVTLTGVVVDDPDVGAVTCDVTTLAPGAQANCTAPTFNVTQAQIDAGGFTNSADVDALDPSSALIEDSDSIFIDAPAAPSVDLEKNADVTSVSDAGDPVNFSFVVTNAGNVTLTGVVVDDPDVGAVTCDVTTLAPGAQANCTVPTFNATQAQVDAGGFTNTADVDALDPSSTLIEDSDSIFIDAPAAPSVDLVKNADVTTVSDAGDPVNFSFVVTNTGNVTLTGVVVDDPDVGAVTCDVTTLAPSEQANCTAPTYTVTQAQIDAGGFTNSADVDALDPSSALIEDSDSIFIDAPAAPSVDLVKNADVTSVSDAGDPVNFSFVVTNTGNVTLTGVVVDDPDVGLVTCDVTSLAPGAQANCTAPTFTVTQAQIDAGGFTNSADVDALDPGSGLVEDSDSIFIDAPAAASVDLVKNADVTTVTDAGDPVNFSFVVTNTGNVTLTGVVVDDADVGAVTCDVTSLAPGAQANCTAPTFNVTQAQIDAGGFTNSADVDALDPSSALIEDSDSIFIDAPAAPAVDLVKNADVTSVSDAGDPVNFSFVVTNTGNVTLTGVVVDDPDVGAVTCDVTTLAPGAQANCTAPTFNVTQAQVDAGGFTNSADVDALDPSSALIEDSDSIFIDAPAAPAVDLVKNADVASVSDAGDPVNFSFVVTNTGNVTLTSVVVDDPDVGAVTCDVTTLAPGAQANCTAPTYTVTQGQIDAGGFTNSADVDALDPSSGLVEDSDSIFIDAPAGPAVDLEKNADVTTVNDAGDPVNFSFGVTNTGNVSLTGVVVDDPDVGAVTCDVTTLAPAEQANCTAPTYTVTQAQIDAGGFTNSADVDAFDPSSGLVEDSDSVFINVPTGPAVDLVKTADVTSVSDAGDPVNFSFVVTNTGNVTLTGVVVDDPDVGLVTCDVTSLAPGAQANCTAPTFNVTQAQIDAGGFTNSADVDALDPGSGLVEDSDSIFIDASAAPAVDLVKNADVTSVSDAGDPVNFSFVVTNTGNVTLTGVVVDDPDVGAVTCDVTTLAPGAQANCTAPTFNVTQAQIDAGGFTNSADVDALDPSSTLVEDSDSIFINAPAAPAVDLEKNADVTTVSDAGDPVNFSFVVTNTGNVTLTGVVVDDPDVGAVTCDVTSLAPGAQANCTAPTFSVTQAQIDAGGFTNSADVDALDPSSALIEDSDSIFIDAPAGPAVDLVKNADVTTVNDAGDPVNFSFVVTNTGNVTLTGVVVDDPDVGAVTCDVTSLAPGAQANCTAPTFNVTQAQIDAGGFTNSADVDALDPSSGLVEDSDSIFINVPTGPAIDLVKTADVTTVTDAGDPVNFSFVVTNTGNVTLTGVVVDDPDVGAVTCDVTSLAPGEQANCTAPTYTVTQGQIDAGGFTNAADVDALDPSSALVEDSDSIFIDAPAGPSVDLEKNADVTTVTDAGDPVNFSFVVTNTGNVTLTGIVVDDPDVGAVTCDVTTLAPGAQANCTAPTFTVTQAQIDAGGFTNSADVDALDPSSTLVEDSDSIFIDAPAGPAVDLEKNADVTTITDAGDPVNFSFVVTNIGNVTLTGVVIDDPDVGAVTCDVTMLAPGSQANCTAPTYSVTQAQIDAGGFTNSADVDALDPSSALVEGSDSIFIDAPAAPSVDLVKSADVTTVNDAGDPVNFSFVVTNTGNVTLTGVVVDDPDVGAVTCDVTSLAPGAQANCTAPTYIVTQAQIDAGGFTNSADVDALDPSSALIEDSDSIFIDAPAAPAVDLEKNADVTTVNDAGDPVNFSFVVTNTGNVTLTGVVVDDPDVGAVTCDVTSLAPGAQTNCTAPTYTVTQAQIDAGGFTNSADVDAFDPGSGLVEDSDSIFINVPTGPAIDLVKNADVTTVNDAGDPVNFSFVVTNTGNVTLSGVVVDDPDVGLVSCDVTSLAPGAQANCTAPTYIVTQAQIDAGGFTNSADVDALDPSSALIEDSDSIFIDAPAAPAVDLEKNADVTTVNDAGDPVNFSFVVTNTGNVTLTGVVVDDPDVGAVTCDVTSLAPGAQTNCTAPTYTVTQAQIDAGGFTNSADVDAFDPGSGLVEDSDSILIDAPADASILLDKDSTTTELTAAGQIVPFTFTVTNTGNVTLTGLDVSDPLIGTVTCPQATLDPSEIVVCTGDYIVTQADVDNGSFVNTAVATASPPSGPDVSDDDSVTTPSTQSPGLTLDKSASLAEVSSVGEQIDYSFEVTNNGNVTITGLAISDPLVGAVTCPTTTLAPAAATTCTSDTPYTVTQPDLDGGSVPNTATAAATSPLGPVEAIDSVAVPVVATPGLSLLKFSTTTELTVAGQPVPFSFVVTNSGNLTVSGITVTDPLIPSISCPTDTAAPGTDITCTGTYFATQTDVDNGQFDNTATADGTAANGDPVSAQDTATTPGLLTPSIELDKTADVTEVNEAGDSILYSFEITNTGNVSVHGVSVDDPKVGTVSCPTTSIPPGGAETCTATYVVTQTDIDAGSVENTATVSGTDPLGTDVEATDSVTVGAPAASDLTLDKSSTTTELTFAGQIVPFTFVVTNTGNVTLDSLSVTDPLVPSITCPGTPIPPAGSSTCTGDYVVTQADVDSGSFVNTATASASPPAGPPITGADTVTTPASQDPVLAMVATGDPTTVNAAGETVAFSFDVTNNGNVTLSGLALTDPVIGAITCPTTTLLPGETVTCTAVPYPITQAQVDAGGFTTTTTASATDPGGAPRTALDSVVVAAPAAPAISMTKATTTTELTFAGQVVPFTFEVTNDGNVTIDGLAVSDPLTGPVSCPLDVLAPAQSTTCTADYIVTQADVDAGQFENTATATATDPNGTTVTAVDTVTTPSPPDGAILIDKLEPTGLLEAGETIDYQLIVRNLGNVTLSSITVIDPTAGPVSCPTTSLGPGASTICTAGYLVAQNDIDAGQIVNVATVQATTPTGGTVTADDTVTTTIDQTPELSLVKATTTTEITFAGQIVPFTFEVSNTGNVTLSGLAVDDPKTGPVTCPQTVLAPAQTTVCTADYVVTQNDVDIGLFANTAVVTATPPAGGGVSAVDTVITPAPQGPDILLEKQDPTGVLEAGETIDWNIVVTNAGNVTLTDVTVTDPVAGPVDCPISTLLPAVSITCSASLVLAQSDVDAGIISNTASVSATTPTGGTVTSEDTVDTVIERRPSLSLVKLTSATLDAVGQVLPYTFTVTNTGNVTLFGLDVEDPLIGFIDCPQTTLAPADQVTCTGGYLVTQADLDAGVVVNVAEASAQDPAGTQVEDTDNEITFGEQTPAIELDKLPPVGTFGVGETITYFFDVVNTGNVTLDNLVVTDPLTGPVTCNTTLLAPGDATLCEAGYVVTQADIDAGSIVNDASVVALPPSGDPVTDDDVETTPLPQDPAVGLEKQPPSGALETGATVTYTFVVTNLGNVTLDGLTVDDPLVPVVVCDTTTVAPGATADCTGDYVVTQQDVDRGEIVNSATVTANPPTGDPIGATDEIVTPIAQNPAIQLDKVAPSETPAVGVTLTYGFTVTNTGDVTVSGLVVTDPLAGAVTCDVADLAPGAAANCSADYVVTQDDVDAGLIRNDATASANDPAGAVVTADDFVETPVDQAPALDLEKNSSAIALVAGETIDFTFAVTNVGDVTLTGLIVDDPLLSSVVTCPVTDLTPGESTTCSGSYAVTQADVDAGSITNTATATATDPGGADVTAVDTLVVSSDPRPSIDIDKVGGAGPFTLGDTVDYELIISNSGNVSLSAISVTDSLVGTVTCPADVLQPGESMTCDAALVVTQADVDAGQITNVADVTSTDPGGDAIEDTDTEVTPVDQVGSIALDKQAPTGSLAVDETITYAFVVTNDGTVSLDNVAVVDPLIGPVDCPVTQLLPTETTTCTGTYVVAQTDVDAGEIVNTATVTGDTPSGSISDTDTETTAVPQAPELTLTKNGPDSPPALGDVILYEFEVVNSGDVTLSGIAVTDPLTTPVACAATDLLPGESTVCSAEYVVTQAAVDAGEIVNTASATALTPSGDSTDANAQVTTPVEQRPAINLDKDAPIGELVVGADISYFFEVTNVGTLTLSDITIVDPLIDPVTCSVTSLDPGQSTTCSAVYTLTQTDVDRGRVVNVASVTSLDTNGEVVTDSDSETTELAPETGLSLTKSAPEGPFLAGDVVTWSFEATNNGNVTLSGLVVDDPLTGPVSCGASSLAPGASTACSAVAVITQDDIDAGGITNTATATAVDPSGDVLTSEATAILDIPVLPAIEVVKSTTVERAALGDSVSFDIRVTNTGNATLVDVAVIDIYSPVTCPQTTLPVGQTMLCTATMIVNQDMVDAGLITNVATAEGFTPSGLVIDENDTEVLVTVDEASEEANISLTKLPPAGQIRSGETVTYSFIVRNTGEVELTDVEVVDPLTSAVDCPSTTLAVGETMTCSSTYQVTAADARDGLIRNTATATALGPQGEESSDSDSIVTAVVQPFLTPDPTPTPVPTLSPRPPLVFTGPPPPVPAAPAPTTIDQPPEHLAYTGVMTAAAVSLAIVLFAAGGALMVGNRRRRDELGL